MSLLFKKPMNTQAAYKFTSERAHAQPLPFRRRISKCPSCLPHFALRHMSVSLFNDSLSEKTVPDL